MIFVVLFINEAGTRNYYDFLGFLAEKIINSCRRTQTARSAYSTSRISLWLAFFSIVIDGAFVSVAVTQAGGSANAAVGADHALDEIVWQQSFAGTQESSFAAVDTVADDRVEHERLTVGAVSITSPIAVRRFARSSSPRRMPQPR